MIPPHPGTEDPEARRGRLFPSPPLSSEPFPSDVPLLLAETGWATRERVGGVKGRGGTLTLFQALRVSPYSHLKGLD